METIKSYKQIIDNKLIEYLEIIKLEQLKESMSYSIINGGKRVRPALLLSTYEALSDKNNYDDVWTFAIALEFIHTYSLVHDDLPAMDNDDFRRGKPTSHKVFGEDIAILSGDALLNTAFEIMGKFVESNLTINNVKAMNIITEASGANGMIMGQMLDMEYENSSNQDVETLKIIHENKTGKLIKASILSGVILSNKLALINEFEKLSGYLGIAFQIQDDILDCTSTFEKLGKPIKSDIKNNKTTYVSIYGLDGAIDIYNDYKTEIVNIIDRLEMKNTKFEKIILEILRRENWGD